MGRKVGGDEEIAICSGAATDPCSLEEEICIEVKGFLGCNIQSCFQETSSGILVCICESFRLSGTWCLLFEIYFQTLTLTSKTTKCVWHYDSWKRNVCPGNFLR